MPRLAVLALVVCVLSVAALVVAIVQGGWLLGLPFLLLAGVSGNIGLYYLRRDRAARG
jgi:hypothetical protein